MSERVLRKSLVVSSDEELAIDSYLARKTNERRATKQRRYSLNSFAIDAMMEKIAREPVE